MPAFLEYAPFLDIAPSSLQDVIVYGFPMLIAVIGLLAMGTYVRRSDRKMVVVAFGIFATTDLLLSLVLYVPNVIGG